MISPTTTTFAVSDVSPASSPLPEVSYKDALDSLLAFSTLEKEREKLASRGWSHLIPEPPKLRPVEACSRYHGRLVVGLKSHPVIEAIHRAFNDHRPLRLSPDAIWLMICQAVANHINVHAEELRHRFVAHHGKALIEVRRDDFVKGSPENPWAEVIENLSEQVRQQVGPSIDLFIPAFSTTGPVERVAAEVVLLEAVKSYFEYALRTMCGIPTITLEGTTSDWESLAQRLEGFKEIGLNEWIAVLRPILRQFVRASMGDVDLKFWRSIYKLQGQSGGPIITGWIVAFFPYLKDLQTKEPTVPFKSLLEGSKDLPEMLNQVEVQKRGFARGLTMESLPGGLSIAPFRWDYDGTNFDMEFLAGFVGIAQDAESLTLRPEIGWAVRDAS